MIPDKIVYIADEVIQSIPLKDNGEKLVNVYDHVLARRAKVRTVESVRLREGIVDKLIAAQNFVPEGYVLFVVDGWRDPEKQGELWQAYRAELAKRHEDWLESEIDAAASKLYSPPGSVMPHATGAAFDITLLDAGENIVPMGTQINVDAESTENRTYTRAQNISKEQIAHRNMLIEALGSVGFINYPTEWWHWSSGDQYSAYIHEQPFAVYGPVKGDS